jgi:hypothetical protein
MRRFLHLPSPAMVVAVAALTVALGGTSYAVITLPTNSVGTKQLRKSAVTSAKIKNGTIKATDLRAALRSAIAAPGPVGPVGAAGPAGPAGPPGAAGGFDLSKIVNRAGAEIVVPADSVDAEAVAVCAAGEKAISGGFVISSDPGTGFAWASTISDDGTAWIVDIDNTGGTEASGFAVVTCARS